jgi:hypothetical protein
VVIDALADAFAGDENNRGQARQFIGLLKGAAKNRNCAFLCLALQLLFCFEVRALGGGLVSSTPE